MVRPAFAAFVSCCLSLSLCAADQAAPIAEPGSPCWPEKTGEGEVFALWPDTNSIPLYSFQKPETADLRYGFFVTVHDVSIPALKAYPAPGLSSPATTSHQPPATSHEPQATSHELPATRHPPSPAVIVCPGGGYWDLGITKGPDAADHLTPRGVRVFVLKYRVPKQREAARCDVQRAISFVRANAARFNIDPKRVGVMGYSAGGHLAAMAATTWTKRAYTAVDEIDKMSCRPDFAILIYPAFLEHEGYGLTPEISKPLTDVPPCFIFQDEEDHFGAAGPAFFLALREAHVPAELHIVPGKGHGYGFHPEHAPHDIWPTLLYAWLDHVIFGKPY